MAARAEVLNTGTSIDKRRAERIFSWRCPAILITSFRLSRTFFLRPYFHAADAAAADRSESFFSCIVCS